MKTIALSIIYICCSFESQTNSRFTLMHLVLPQVDRQHVLPGTNEINVLGIKHSTGKVLFNDITREHCFINYWLVGKLKYCLTTSLESIALLTIG